MTVRNLLLDANGDIAPLVNGNLQLVSDVASIQQAVACNLRTFLGEWFLDDPDDPKVGVPYFQDVLKKNPDVQQLRSVFSSVILGTLGMSQLTLLDMRYDQAVRSLSIAWRGISDIGQLVSGQLAVSIP